MNPAPKEDVARATPVVPSNQLRIEVAGTELVLLPNRLAWWPEGNVLLLADSHFGKAATFRNAGLPVPAGTTERMLEQLSLALDATAARELIILGDFIHSSTRANIDFEDDLLAWRHSHASLPIKLIRGNHDRHNERIFETLEFEVEAAYQLGPFRLVHDATTTNIVDDEFRLGGHLHPGFPDHGGGKKMLPCFWLGKHFLVLPAFGCFTGLARFKPAADDRVFAISGNEIAQVHPLLFKPHF